MDLRRLRYFVVAAEEGNFRRAAVRLGTRQSVISRRVRDIEDELGADLFHRQPGHGAQLTEVGRVLLGDVREMLTHLDRAEMATQAVAYGKRGRLRLAASEDVMTATLARIIAAYRQQWRDVHLDLFEMPPGDQMRALQRGMIDLGLMLPPVDGPNISTDPVWSESWLVALPEVHPLAIWPSLNAADFAGENVIVGHAERGPRCGRHVLTVLDVLHVDVRIVAEVEHLQTKLMLVQSAAGIAFVPGDPANVTIPGIEFRTFTPAKGQIVIHAAWPEGNASGLVAQFLRVAHRERASGDGWRHLHCENSAWRRRLA